MDDRRPVDLRCSVLVLRDDQVLLCQKPDGTWVLPGGTPHQGEGSAAAAAREVAEETGLEVAAVRVAFVLETTSWEDDHHLIEIVFLGDERDRRTEPAAREPGLVPSFVPTSELGRYALRPPLGGYIRGLAPRARVKPESATAAYLGNLWRPDVDPPQT